MENVAAAQAILLPIFILLIFISQVTISVNCTHTWSMSSPVPSSELDALIKLKVRLANSEEHLRSWNASSLQNVCKSWAGVTCSYVSGQSYITGINLAGFGLVGSLPSQLGNLSFMFTLNLSSNLLSGGIPAELSHCTSLQILDLNHNRLTGHIPPSLSSLSSLQVLWLCNNNLSGPIPPTLFTNCTSLVKLSLCLNFLNGSIPAQICQQHNPRLQSLYLWGNNLTGPIPRSLGNCTGLIHLELDGNQLSRPIPTELGFLVQLQYLYLFDNHLTGLIPTELGLLVQLQYLYLYDNHLGGAIPRSLGNCTSLLDLELLENQLSGLIPTELGHLAHLQTLYLWGNNLTGTIPATLGNCTQLVNLELASNQLSGLIPTELGHLARLQTLYLWGNSLTGTIPATLSNCTQLVDLELASNQLSGLIPTELGHLARLQALYLWANNLTGTIPATLGNCTQLVNLELGRNQLTGFIPSDVLKLTHLQYLSLHQNRLLGFEPPFGNATSLIALYLSHNQVGGSIPAGFAQLHQLQYLDLGYNQLSGNNPWSSLSNCTFLYHLDLSHNHLAGPGLSSELGRLLHLRQLDLSRNFLQGRIPHLGGLITGLQSVDVSFNQLNGSLPDSLAHVLQDVVFLNFSHNNLSGNLPSWLVQLSMVQEIDLSHNYLAGTIPQNLGDCMALQYLNLSCNNLTGELSLHFSNNNSDLIPLDLSNNELTGMLPSALQYLKHLRFLNVSFNNFKGPIPHFGVFQHLDASCFQRNPGLCGSIMHKLCKPDHHRVHHLGWRMTVAIALVTSFVPTIILLVIFYHKYRRSKEYQVAMADCQLQNLVEVRHFSARDLWESTQGYAEQNLLGNGAVAVVYKGILSNGEVVAIKKFRGGITSSREALLQEVRILSKLRHRNLVKILGCVLDLDVHALVLELMPNGSLEQYLCQATDKDDLKRLSLEMVLKIAQGVSNALMYLHHEYDAAPIIHGDIKPSNILLDSNLEAHLADFGLAKLAKSNTKDVSLASNFKGSIGYMAPEFAFAIKVTTKVDVFSFGVVILEMLTGRGPLDELLHGVSLHEWTKQKMLSNDSINLCEIMHASLLQNSSSEIEMDESKIWKLLQMALACTEELPSRRPTMKYVKAFIDSILSSSVSV